MWLKWVCLCLAMAKSSSTAKLNAGGSDHSIHLSWDSMEYAMPSMINWKLPRPWPLKSYPLGLGFNDWAWTPESFHNTTTEE
jgi:hypothetical protein